MINIVVIGIITHKSKLTISETASLKRCYEILGSYPIKIICPHGLDLTEYYLVNKNIDIQHVNPIWLSSYDMFNKFKTSTFLYKLFYKFEYILFYELDAWVFSDKLQYWISQKYDYIGAPWFSSLAKNDLTASIIGVGNGGFSLRNVKKTYEVLKRVNQLRILNKFWRYVGMSKFVGFQKLILRFNFYFKVARFWELPYLLDETQIQEDVFLSYRVAATFSDYKVAPPQEALKFSFEVNPSVLYEMNDRHLPFGCHAWEKYDPNFWKQFISIN